MDDNSKKCKKNCSEYDKICNGKTGRCIKAKVLKSDKKKSDSVKNQALVTPKKSSQPSPKQAKTPSVSSKKSSSHNSSKQAKPSSVSQKKSSPVPLKKKLCKEDCSIMISQKPRKCNYETGRCKVYIPEPTILDESDCSYNQKLNEKKTRCIAMDFSDRYKLFSNYKVYFTVSKANIEKAQNLGAKWDDSSQKLFFTSDLPLGKVLKLNQLSLNKPEKKYLYNEDVPYFYRQYAKAAGAYWDPVEKKWYYFDNLPKYNIYMLNNTDWKQFDYRLTYELSH